MPTFSPLIDRALVVSATAHRNQVRKGSQVPYVIHPVHVALLLIRHQFPDEVIIAALLHDVVEDTSITLAELQAEFGEEVARLVAAVSEQKTEGTEPLPWKVRKEAQLRKLGLTIGSLDIFHPLLLKPEADTHSQVVLMGQVDEELSRMPWRGRSASVWPQIAAVEQTGRVVEAR